MPPQVNPIEALRPASASRDALIRRALLRWFRKHFRPLPWRTRHDAYAIWVSEIMLQQTQVATVIPYYERFLSAFPTVERLARARIERVLELWSGLGYYRRARHLHAAARKLVAHFGGRFPATAAAARALPGVGSYTAAAVLSIAYGVPLAALDGNAARVIARLSARSGNLADRGFRKALEASLGRLLSRRRPGHFNQALMELGQTVCLPRTPRCGICPVRAWCRARRAKHQEDYPSPRPRRAAEEHYLAAAVVVAPRSERALLVRGLEGGLMSDLWNFPSAFGASPREARTRLETYLGSLRELGPGSARIGSPIARLAHVVTYRRIQVVVYGAEPDYPPDNSPRPLPVAVPSHPHVSLRASSTVRWLKFSGFERAAVSQLARKIARAAQIGLAPEPVLRFPRRALNAHT